MAIAEFLMKDLKLMCRDSLSGIGELLKLDGSAGECGEGRDSDSVFTGSPSAFALPYISECFFLFLR